jgi:hypothetical protein
MQSSRAGSIPAPGAMNYSAVLRAEILPLSCGDVTVDVDEPPRRAEAMGH